jgi:CTP synthase (UTP-ammonia lyase)
MEMRHQERNQPVSKYMAADHFSERHRHRYEYNSGYVEQLQKVDCWLLG